jgi:phosphoribosylamine--glycine ligase
MGAYAPVPQVTDQVWKSIEREVFAPFLKGLREEDMDYGGVIYFGLMLTKDGPKVLEFNVRFGDPETQVILPMVENDWVDLFQATLSRRLESVSLKIRKGAAVVVAMTAKGYPGDYEKGREIRGLDPMTAWKDVIVFHAGTVRKDGRVVTAGGRVLGVTALGQDLESARRRAYEAVEAIHFDGAHYRKDIAVKALRHGIMG